MKKNFGLIILVLLAVFLFVAGCVPQPSLKTSQPAMEQGQGRAVFLITDAAADMGAVTSVQVTVDAVKVHSASQGWVTVSSEQKTYDLLQLKAEGSQALLADVSLETGTYEQVRLDISKVVVIDDQGEHEAKLPSGELKIVGNLVVNADSTSTATFDFMANESLHVTGKGEYILAPVVQLETREDAEVELKADERVEVKQGRVKTKVKVGMDADGNVGVGLGISSTANVTIADGRVKIGLGLIKEKKVDENADTNAGAQANAGVKVGIGGGY